MNKKAELKYKLRLEHELTELDQMLRSQFQGVAVNPEGDMLERVLAGNNREFSASILEEMRQKRNLVVEALKRIHADTFGTCTECGQDISPKRLEVIPWAPLCIKCQKSLEESGKTKTNSWPITGLADAEAV